MAAEENEPAAADRRSGDRRQMQAPIDFADRRQGDRRSGKDRRASPRS